MGSIASAVVLAICGRLENRSAAGALNGPSQWIYGRSAAYERRPGLRQTLVGFAIHHLMATGWALLHERMFGADKAAQPAATRLRRAAVTAAAANFVDYRLTPKRLQPGFDVQLSRKSLFAVYAAFAIGLTIVTASARKPRFVRK